MAVYNIFFSPTGGTRKAADILSLALCEKAESINTISIGDYSREFCADDICVFSVPSFGGRVPEAALERISQMKGMGAAAVLLVAYGNRAIDDTLLELRDCAVQAGFKILAGVEAVTQHSLAPSCGAGRPDAQDEAELKAFAEKIKVAFKADRAEPEMPGKRPYREFGGVPAKPKGDESCISCGLCAAECPTGAIDKANTRLTDKSKCISCMHCVSICPQGARKLNAVAAAGIEAGLKKICSGRKENKLYI